MLWFGQAVIDAALSAGVFDCMRPDEFPGLDRGSDLRCGGCGVARRGEMRAVVGEHRVDLVGECRDEMAEKVGRGPSRDLLVKFDEGELGYAVDRHEQVELALRDLDLDLRRRRDP